MKASRLLFITLILSYCFSSFAQNVIAEKLIFNEEELGQMDDDFYHKNGAYPTKEGNVYFYIGGRVKYLDKNLNTLWTVDVFKNLGDLADKVTYSRIKPFFYNDSLYFVIHGLTRNELNTTTVFRINNEGELSRKTSIQEIFYNFGPWLFVANGHIHFIAPERDKETGIQYVLCKIEEDLSITTTFIDLPYPQSIIDKIFSAKHPSPGLGFYGWKLRGTVGGNAFLTRTYDDDNKYILASIQIDMKGNIVKQQTYNLPKEYQYADLKFDQYFFYLWDDQHFVIKSLLAENKLRNVIGLSFIKYDLNEANPVEQALIPLEIIQSQLPKTYESLSGKNWNGNMISEQLYWAPTVTTYFVILDKIKSAMSYYYPTKRLFAIELVGEISGKYNYKFKPGYFLRLYYDETFNLIKAEEYIKSTGVRSNVNATISTFVYTNNVKLLYQSKEEDFEVTPGKKYIYKIADNLDKKDVLHPYKIVSQGKTDFIFFIQERQFKSDVRAVVVE